MLLFLASYHHYNNDAMTWDDNDNGPDMVCFLYIVYYSFLLTKYYVVAFSFLPRCGMTTNNKQLKICIIYYYFLLTICHSF
jgi:hypothetical protein